MIKKLDKKDESKIVGGIKYYTFNDNKKKQTSSKPKSSQGSKNASQTYKFGIGSWK